MQRGAVPPVAQLAAHPEAVSAAARGQHVPDFEVVLRERNRVPEIDAEAALRAEAGYADRWRLRRRIARFTVLADPAEVHFVQRLIGDHARIARAEKLIEIIEGMIELRPYV